MSNHLDRVSAGLGQLVSGTQPCTCSPLTLLIPGFKLETALGLRNMLESGGVSRLLPHMWEAEELASLVAALGGKARVEPVEQEMLLEPLLFSYGSVATVDPATDHLQVQGSEVHSTTHYLVVTTLQCSAGSALHCVHPDPSLSWPTLQHRHLTSPPLRCRWPILLM
jgi:hypothetical protein